MQQARRGTILWGFLVSTLTLSACETSRIQNGIQPDVVSPVITLTNPGSDTQNISQGLQFNVSAIDNLALKSVRVTFSGGLLGFIDTTFIGTNKTYARSYVLGASVIGTGAGGGITLIGRATDGAGNFGEDTLFIFLVNVQALRVNLLAPSQGAIASQGRSIPVSVEAIQASGIAKIGFLVSPANAVTNPTTPPADSIVFTAPLADSVVYTDTLNVLSGGPSFNVQGFAEDSSGRRGVSQVITVTIQSVANDNTPPVVQHRVNARVEVDDSITVHATDPSAISWIGFRVDTGNVIGVKFDTINVAAGNLTDVSRRMPLNLAPIISKFPSQIVIQGYACDAATARNCSFTNNPTPAPSAPAPLGTAGPARAPGALIDTVIVVAGVTVALPVGGRIADAIFNGNDSTLYLTNPDLGRVEIFQVANTAFVATGIPTAGPTPWGIALWPRDTLGNYGDTIVVANAGGTQLSVIDVRAAVRRLAWRQDLPDFLIETYKILTAPLREVITVHDVSDRPQYVATVCRPAGGTACAKDSVFAIYSTTPTESSDEPFNGRATLRMEKLRNPSEFNFNPDSLFGHLFWELAGDSTLNSDSRDTLRIELRRGRPYNQQKVVLSACPGVTVILSRFGLGDSTFMRNSGNFTHAIMGEGGNITTDFARVVGYTTKADLIQGPGTARSCITAVGALTNITDSGENHRDVGVTPAIDVSDFISNTGSVITAIATNFNGGTNLVRASSPTTRADSVYVLDEGLRLKGTMCSEVIAGSGCLIGTPGMDMNYNHAFAAGSPGTPTFGGTGNPNDRLVFTARPDGNIDIFDTFFYGRIGTIPTRDPIIGPLRVARNSANTRQWLFGVTARGVVMVELPVVVNPFPTQAPFGNLR